MIVVIIIVIIVVMIVVLVVILLNVFVSLLLDGINVIRIPTHTQIIIFCGNNFLQIIFECVCQSVVR